MFCYSVVLLVFILTGILKDARLLAPEFHMAMNMDMDRLDQCCILF